jgi:hypothetical protein
VAETEPTQGQRQFLYLLVLIDEAGLDRDALAAMTPEAQYLTIIKAIRERNVNEEDVAGWISQCDPPGTPPGTGPVDCFRLKAALALRDPINIPLSWSISAGFWFVVAFGASWWAKR